mmetsp:Transcript_15401/g.30286  ORF Transcript_15401/g.30286 Transcript_15401/m.30286 type:complete len:338 (-) Transcript_15401:81-1094(-)
MRRLFFFPLLVLAVQKYKLEVPGQPDRDYAISVPSALATPGQLLPVLFYLHGQGDSWPGSNSTSFDALGQREGFITVYPKGLGDFNGTIQDSYIAWNTGLYDGGLQKADDTCFADTVGTCYDSCKAQQLCSNCGWSTCHDDVLFLSLLIDHVIKQFQGDADRVYILGCSNGGMMTHHLAQRLGPRLAAVMPVYGLPLIGFLNVSSPLASVPILQLHDRSDTVIPLQGGASGDGWLYYGVTATLSAWARVHRCHHSATSISTPFDGGSVHLSCISYHGCQEPTVSKSSSREGNTSGDSDQNRAVVLCTYDGEHGSWPAHAEELAWWFFQKHSRRPAFQ